MAMAKEKNPFEIPCFDLNKTLQSKVFDPNKKRKLQVDQIGLPFPKHQCSKQGPADSVDSMKMDSEKVNTLFRIEENPPKESQFYDSQNFNETMEELEQDLMIYSDVDESSGDFVLSSGRWNVNQKNSQDGLIKKPTIDQEFEEYFSMLML